MKIGALMETENKIIKTIGTLSVVDSGVILSNKLEPTIFELIDKGLPLKVIVEVDFEKDVEARMHFNTENSQTLRVVFTCPKLPMFGTPTPTKLGTFSDRELYMSLRVSVCGDGKDRSYMLFYTISLGKEEADE